MCAKRNYSLLSAEPNCTWLKINKVDLNVTSIVDALENNEDPSTLLFGDDRLKSGKLNCLLQDVDNVRLWLDQTLQPSLQVMDKKDVTQCVRKLHVMRNRLSDILKTSKKRVNRSKQYKCICRVCNRGVIISETNCDVCLAASPANSEMSSALVCNALAHTNTQHKYDALCAEPETQMSPKGNQSNSGGSVSDESENNHSESGEVQNTSLDIEISEGGDSSDMSSKASVSQTDRLLAALNRLMNDDTDEDLSEISMKSHVIYNSGYSTAESLRTPQGSRPAGAEIETELTTGTDTQEMVVAVESVAQRNSEEIHLPPVDGRETSLANNSESTTKHVAIIPAPTVPKNDASSPTGNKTTKKLEHNVIIALQSKPQDAVDYLEHRLRVHRPFLDFVNNKAHCSLCVTHIAPTVLEIKGHLSTFAHMKRAQKELGGATLRHTYLCDLCNKKMYTEQSWFDHVVGADHSQRNKHVAKVNKPKGGAFMEYECISCRYVIFGNRHSVNKHLSEVPTSAARRRKKEIKLPQLVERLFKDNEYFNSEVARLCKDSNKVLKSIDLSWKCCEAIQNALEPVFGKCKAYPFGSRVSGLGNTLSDLDVFVDTGIMYSGLLYQDAENQAGFVKHTAKALKKHKDFSHVFAIPSARTPIVQVFHRLTNLDCDLSFRHGLSVENTKFLRLCIDVQPPLKPFILILKMWSNMCKLNERISTYALSMMSIFFFQLQGYLPSVQRIRQLDSTQAQVIGGWTTFCYNRPIPELQQQMLKCDKTTRELLCAFFGHFAQFKYKTEVLCPLLGRTVPKVDFHEDNGHRLPPEMLEYVAKIRESEQNEVFRSLSAMCIQDPFDLSHNLTKACPESVVKKFGVLCAMSSAILASK